MHPLPLLTTLLTLFTSTLSQRTGAATFYTGNLAGGACSFSTYTLPANLHGTALSSDNWSNSAPCGACILVTGPSGTQTTAMIVDECPECGPNGLDLFQDAFGELAPLSRGSIQVGWEYVTCPVQGALQVHLKEGVSQWWFSAQVVNGNKAVSDLQVSADGGKSWMTGLKRQGYNFFERSAGTGSTTVAVKAISVDGDEVVVKNIQVTSGNLVTASKNFASAVSKRKHRRKGRRAHAKKHQS